MIESMRFTNVNGALIDLNDNVVPVGGFTTEVDVRMTEREKALQHGMYPSNTYLGKRVFHINGDLLLNSSAEYWAKRLAMISAFTPRPHLGYSQIGKLDVSFTGLEALTTDCTIDGWPELPLEALSPSAGKFNLNLKSFDPRLYGAYQQVDVAYGIGDNIGGRVYNAAFNRTYVAGIGTTVGSAIVTNSGNIETYPLVTFYGPVVSPRISLVRGDGTTFYFTLNGLSLASIANTVTVDFLRRTAVTETGANVYNYTVGSDWFPIEPSANMSSTIRYVSLGAGSAPSHAIFQWRNAYMI